MAHTNRTATMITTDNAQTFPFGSVPWSSVTLASVQDSLPATAAFLGSDDSDYCHALTFKTLPRITANDRITGLGCGVNGLCDVDSSCRITRVELTTGTGATYYPATSILDAAKPFETGFKLVEVGGDGEMWGLTSAQMLTLLNTKFMGFKFVATEETGVSANVEIDGMFLIVYYYKRPHLKLLLGVGI